MALYKDANTLRHSNHSAFDTIHPVGATVANSGIYRCEGCGREISHNKNDRLPPQNHHQHATSQGQVRWKLIISAET